MIIWLASYPRSGNTFFRVLLKHYYDIQTYSVYDEAFLAQKLKLHEGAEGAPAPDMAQTDQQYFVKTHDMPSDEHPAIYLVRDGRDALVSYAHYILEYETKENPPQNMEDAFRHTLHDLIVYKASFGGWGPNVLAWAKRPAPTAIIRFEDLVTSPDPVTILQHAFETLKVSEHFPIHKNAPPSFANLHETMPKFFREGKVGGWRETMPPELVELFLQHHGDALDFLGYSR